MEAGVAGRLSTRERIGFNVRRGRTGQGVPPLVAHVSVSLHTDRAAVRQSVRRELGMYARAPFYQRMFADAEYPLGADGVYSDELLDHLVLLDDGIDELLIMLLPVQDQVSEEQCLLKLLGGM